MRAQSLHGFAFHFACAEFDQFYADRNVLMTICSGYEKVEVDFLFD